MMHRLRAYMISEPHLDAIPQAVFEVFLFSALFLMMPFSMVLSLALLIAFLGTPAFLGIGIMLVNMLASERCGLQVKKYQTIKNKKADERSVVLNECLQGIRTVKMSAWEHALEGRVQVNGSRNHVNCSLNHVNCSLNHVNCSPTHVHRSVNRVNCSPNRVHC
jgi:ABC-type multidrug transport system fused ATPase/permease subunit